MRIKYLNVISNLDFFFFFVEFFEFGECFLDIENRIREEIKVMVED